MKNHRKAKTLALLLSAAMLVSAAPGAGILSPVVVMAEDTQSDTKTSIKNATINGSFTGLIYNGNEQKPIYTVELNNKTLVKDTDYTEEWSNNINAGTATLTIKGMGSYKDSNKKTFTIAKQSPVVSQAVTTNGSTKETGDTIKRVDYDGTSKSFTYIVKDPDGTDCTDTLGKITTLTYTKDGKKLSDPIMPGTYTVSIVIDPGKSTDDTIKKNYNKVTYNGQLVINKIDLSRYTLTLTSGNDYTYTGNAIKPAFNLTKPDSTVDYTAVRDKDYTVTYPDAKNVGGPYTITVTGKGAKYTGSVQAGFYIKSSSTTTGFNFAETADSKDSEQHYISFDPENIPDQQWTGKAITPTPKLIHHWKDSGNKDHTEELKQGTDYTVTYENNKDIASNTAKAIFTGKGRFKNVSITKTFSIVRKSLSDKTISVSLSPASYSYTGKSITPRVTVTDTSVGKVLTQGSEYTLSYPDRNNTNAGSYIRVQISGFGNNYTGSVEKTFRIAAHPITASEFTIDPEVVTVNGTGTSASIAPQTVKIGYTQGGDSRLATDDITKRTSTTENGIDGPANFTVSYKNNTAAGTAAVTIKGKNNYSGTVTKTFKIIVQNPNAKDLAAKQGEKPITAISDIPAQTYTGSQLRPSVTVRYNGVALGGNDYEVSYGANNAAGTGSVTVTGKNNYKGSVMKSFRINPASISSASVSVSSVEYTGGPVRPAVSAVFAGSTLREGTDYRVDYRNNTKIGTGSVSLTGIGNFTGTREVSFSIVRKAAEQEKVEATGFTLAKLYKVRAGETVTLQPVLTPSDANTYQIRWSTGNPDFRFLTEGGTYTGYTSDSKPAVVLAPASGETVITGELILNGKTAATVSTTVKVARIFDDVPQSGTYYSDAVYRLTEDKIINGASDTIFNPGGRVTRAQFAAFLYRAAGSPAVSSKAEDTFADCRTLGGGDFDAAIAWCVSKGIALGKGNRHFDPNGTVTRAEAVTFLQRYAGGSGSVSSEFTDVHSSDWYSASVGWAVANGVTRGTGPATFSPGRNCSRAEAACFLYNTIK